MNKVIKLDGTTYAEVHEYGWGSDDRVWHGLHLLTRPVSPDEGAPYTPGQHIELDERGAKALRDLLNEALGAGKEV